jgi:hypothetical protein
MTEARADIAESRLRAENQSGQFMPNLVPWPVRSAWFERRGHQSVIGSTALRQRKSVIFAARSRLSVSGNIMLNLSRAQTQP